MDQERLASFFKENLLIVGLFLLGVICLCIGLFQLTQSSKPIEVVASAESEESTSTTSTVIVDVSGAVKNPGVYTLPTDSRVDDALKAAGGVTSEADTQVLSKIINRAAKLQDGQKIFVPVTGSETTVSGANTTSLVNINSATSRDLEDLPGIGAVTAQKIIDARPFNTVDELLSRDVIGTTVFNKVKDLISVY